MDVLLEPDPPQGADSRIQGDFAVWHGETARFASWSSIPLDFRNFATILVYVFPATQCGFSASSQRVAWGITGPPLPQSSSQTSELWVWLENSASLNKAEEQWKTISNVNLMPPLAVCACVCIPTNPCKYTYTPHIVYVEAENGGKLWALFQPCLSLPGLEFHLATQT